MSISIAGTMPGSAKLLIASCNDSNMRYATGLAIMDPFIWARFGDGKKAKEYVIVSSLEYALAKKQAKPHIKVLLLDKISLDNVKKPVGRRRNLADVAAAFLISYNIGEVLVPQEMHILHADSLREYGLRIRIAEPFFQDRIIKTAKEIAEIKKTGVVAKQAMQCAIDMIKKSTIEWDEGLYLDNAPLTSERIKFEIEKIFMLNDCSSNETIISCGEQASEPHNRGSGQLYAGQPIVMDLFPRHNRTGYYFDMTRTIVKGTPSAKIKKLFTAVENAQLAAIKAVKPGRKASEVHIAAENVFRKLGYKTTEEEGFIHGTGHGIGIDIHEDPNVGPRSETILKEGMVITIEPGLYYKELGGVRIEDTVLVGKNGCINLTNFQKVTFVK